VAKVALAKLATQIDDFEGFSDAYWNECLRGVYYVPTSREDFDLGKLEHEKARRGAFYAACSPDLAVKISPNAKDVEYIAEIRTVDVLPSEIRPMRKGKRGVVAIDDLSGVEVLRVMDREKAMKSWVWQNSVLPSSEADLYEFWKNAREKESGARRKRIQKEEAKKSRMERKAKKKKASDPLENPSKAASNVRKIPSHVNTPKC
jgi:hypothetical protein